MKRRKILSLLLTLLTGLSFANAYSQSLEKEDITVYKDIVYTIVEGPELNGEGIMWNFQGEIFDSKLDEKFEIMYMQGEKYEPSLEGVGYHIRIKEDKTLDIEKRVYRKNSGEAI
jgi:hypothetical protein